MYSCITCMSMYQTYIEKTYTTYRSILQQEESFFFFLVSNEAMSVGGSTLQMHFVGQCGTGQVFRLLKLKFYLKADSLTQMMKWQTSNRCLCRILWGKGCGPE